MKTEIKISENAKSVNVSIIGESIEIMTMVAQAISKDDNMKCLLFGGVGAYLHEELKEEELANHLYSLIPSKFKKEKNEETQD